MRTLDLISDTHQVTEKNEQREETAFKGEETS